MNTEFKAGFALIGFIIAIVWGGVWFDEQSCLTKGRSFSDVEYSVIGGCMVNHNDRWLPLENIRGFDGN